MRSRPTALIADDEPLLRDALAAQLAQLWPELEVVRSEEHTSELQSPCNLVCRLLLEKKRYGCTTRRISSRYRSCSMGGGILSHVRVQDRSQTSCFTLSAPVRSSPGCRASSRNAGADA